MKSDWVFAPSMPWHPANSWAIREYGLDWMDDDGVWQPWFYNNLHPSAVRIAREPRPRGMYPPPPVTLPGGIGGMRECDIADTYRGAEELLAHEANSPNDRIRKSTT